MGGGAETEKYPYHFMLQKLAWDKLLPDEPLGSCVDLIMKMNEHKIRCNERNSVQSLKLGRTETSSVSILTVTFLKASQRLGGENAILLRESLSVSLVDERENRSFEFSEWIVKSRSLRFVIVYRPPASLSHSVSSSVFFEEFAHYLRLVFMFTNAPNVALFDLWCKTDGKLFPAIWLFRKFAEFFQFIVFVLHPALSNLRTSQNMCWRGRKARVSNSANSTYLLEYGHHVPSSSSCVRERYRLSW